MAIEALTGVESDACRTRVAGRLDNWRLVELSFHARLR
jgi:hypothetical protein